MPYYPKKIRILAKRPTHTVMSTGYFANFAKCFKKP